MAYSGWREVNQGWSPLGIPPLPHSKFLGILVELQQRRAALSVMGDRRRMGLCWMRSGQLYVVENFQLLFFFFFAAGWVVEVYLLK